MCKRRRPSWPKKEVANDDHRQEAAEDQGRVGVLASRYWTTMKSRKHYEGYKSGKGYIDDKGGSVIPLSVNNNVQVIPGLRKRTDSCILFIENPPHISNSC